MSDSSSNLGGSAARHHEETGGNVPTGRTPLPSGGDAARHAESQGDSINEAHGVRTAARGEYQSSRSIQLSSARGARLVEPEPALPDFSKRTAADYLPPRLKAQLIAEGKLPPEPGMEPVAAAPVTRSAPETDRTPVVEPVPESKGLFGTLGRLFRKLF